MKLARVMLAATVLAVCGSSAALAGPKVMATAPADQDSPTGQIIYCDIVNLDTQPRDVTIEVMDINGLVVSGPLGPLSYPPNTGQALAAFPGSGGAWCRFTVDGATKKFRGVAVYDDGLGYTLSIPAQ